MIKATDVTMKFHTPGKEPFVALNQMSCEIPRGCIYGMIGANGAGKSTFLRLLAGVYRPYEGTITVDDMPVWENPAAKSRIVYIPDDLYFLPQSSMNSMAKLYRALYPQFDFDRFNKLTETFQLDPTANVNTFSKGMRRQAVVCCSHFWQRSPFTLFYGCWIGCTGNTSVKAPWKEPRSCTQTPEI